MKSLGYQLATQLFVGDVKKHYREIITHDGLELSKRYLNYLHNWCSMHVPYYSKLKKYPILTKNLIRNNYSALISDSRLKGRYKNSSGGSTGEPITLLQDREYNSWTRATENYYFQNFLGVVYEETPKVVLWGSERDAMRQKDWKGLLYNWLSETTFLNSFNAGDREWQLYTQIINNTKPYFIKGYAGSLYFLSQYIKQHNLKVYHPRFIYTSAETLGSYMRKLIEEVFSAKVYDYYGSREVGAIAGECHKGVKHVFSFNNILEIVDIKHQRPSTEGKILVTNLHNWTMPLIRYEIGDIGGFGRKCTCGSNLPVLNNIHGRITDNFFTLSGDTVHGEFFTHLFYYRNWVKKFKVIQKDYLLLEISLVLNGPLNITGQQEIERKIRVLMGKSCQIVWKIVPDIPPTSQGKYLYTKSEVKLP